MKLARGPLVIFLPLALAFLLSFCGCRCSTESRTHANGNKLKQPVNQGGNTWCIVKPSTDTDRLLYNIDYSCAQTHVNCSSIQLGGSCFHPKNSVSYASFSMNLFYKSAGKHPWNCHFNGTGLIVTQNPSFGNCHYPG
ncbi:glucan endo-1,3-beta-D-glucosidase-like [Alnus glutinosa]|uniref:glucan endo-1,3-beta-D-glucosidase-like n=1 Tax=Alnus glutinosa TaxID=3517 RepID=UPI002D7A1377|nr:glucan endo-1,3-beta-D-glucosidase-like [Alnus glutinosa]